MRSPLHGQPDGSTRNLVRFLIGWMVVGSLKTAMARISFSFFGNALFQYQFRQVGQMEIARFYVLIETWRVIFCSSLEGCILIN